MKTILAFLGSAAIVAALAPAYAQSRTPSSSSSAAIAHSTADPAAAIARAKAIMALKLKDSDSARYVDLTVGHGEVCGWVNATNSFGGYAGYKPFVVMSTVAEIRDDDDVQQTFNNHYMFAEAWYRCHPEARTKLGSALVTSPKINIERQCDKLYKRTNDAAGGARCRTSQAEAKSWLASYPTADWIADICSREVRAEDSYLSGRICVVEHESQILFAAGPPASGL